MVGPEIDAAITVGLEFNAAVTVTLEVVLFRGVHSGKLLVYQSSI